MNALNALGARVVDEVSVAWNGTVAACAKLKLSYTSGALA